MHVYLPSLWIKVFKDEVGMNGITKPIFLYSDKDFMTLQMSFKGQESFFIFQWRTPTSNIIYQSHAKMDDCLIFIILLLCTRQWF